MQTQWSIILNIEEEVINKQHGFFLLAAQNANPIKVANLLHRLNITLCMIRHFDWYDVHSLDITEYGRRLVKTLRSRGIRTVAHVDMAQWVGESAKLVSHIRNLQFDGVYFDVVGPVDEETRTNIFNVVTRSLPEVHYWQSALSYTRPSDTRAGQIDYWDDKAHKWTYNTSSRTLVRRQSPRAAINGLIGLLPKLRGLQQVADLGWFGPKIHVTEEGTGHHDRDATIREWWFHSVVARKYPAYMMIRSTWDDWQNMRWRRLKEWIVRRATSYVRR